MTIITVGISLAKSVFAVPGVDTSGKAVMVKPKVPRVQLLMLIAQLPPCLIGMEACSGAHHWARLFGQYGMLAGLRKRVILVVMRGIGQAAENH